MAEARDLWGQTDVAMKMGDPDPSGPPIHPRAASLRLVYQNMGPPCWPDIGVIPFARVNMQRNCPEDFKQSLTLLWRRIGQTVTERAQLCLGPARMFACGAGRLMAKPQGQPVTMSVLWADRPGYKPAAAGGADVAQHRLHAAGAIGAFIAANAGIGAVWRQIDIASFAVRT